MLMRRALILPALSPLATQRVIAQPLPVLSTIQKWVTK